MSNFTKEDALQAAIEWAKVSPCAKSKRGVVLFNEAGVHTRGCNRPPPPLICGNDDACREACGKICIHAEQDALIDINDIYTPDGQINLLQLLHVKVVNGQAIPSGPPSCWQCSKLILTTPSINGIWLLHENGLKLYAPLTFHLKTLETCGLPANR